MLAQMKYAAKLIMKDLEVIVLDVWFYKIPILTITATDMYC